MANPYSAAFGNRDGERVEVSRRHSSSDSSGRRPERGKEEGHSISSGMVTSPTRMSQSGRVVEKQPTQMTTVEEVVSSENMQQAWQRIKANKGAAGIDEMSITDYPEFARANWPGIKVSLLDGKYNPAPVKRV